MQEHFWSDALPPAANDRYGYQWDVTGRLRSAATNRLIVPSVRLSTVGSRAFPAAASSIWNTLPENVSASTLQSFQHHLKTFLFRRSFPDIVL